MKKDSQLITLIYDDKTPFLVSSASEKGSLGTFIPNPVQAKFKENGFTVEKDKENKGSIITFSFELDGMAHEVKFFGRQGDDVIIPYKKRSGSGKHYGFSDFTTIENIIIGLYAFSQDLILSELKLHKTMTTWNFNQETARQLNKR